MVANRIWEDGESSKEQEPLSPLEKERLKTRGSLNYHPDMPGIAYNCLAKSSNAKTKSHVCVLLQCSKPTLTRWEKKFPEFRKAIADGLEAGSIKWRNKIAKHAWKPGAKVNNGLIKLLSNNVYGIKEEVDPTIIFNNNTEVDPEKLMKNRGIPIPKTDIEDLDETEE